MNWHAHIRFAAAPVIHFAVHRESPWPGYPNISSSSVVRGINHRKSLSVSSHRRKKICGSISDAGVSSAKTATSRSGHDDEQAFKKAESAALTAPYCQPHCRDIIVYFGVRAREREQRKTFWETSTVNNCRAQRPADFILKKHGMFASAFDPVIAEKIIAMK